MLSETSENYPAYNPSSIDIRRAHGTHPLPGLLQCRLSEDHIFFDFVNNPENPIVSPPYA